MPTPLYDSLTAFAESGPLRLHMPGHKGRAVPGLPEDWARLDFTELTPTGNLFEGGDAIEAAEALWAEKFGAETALFLTGGSTLGVHAGVYLCCRPGDTVLADRNSHRSLWNALALAGAEPVYLTRPWDETRQLMAPLSPETVERALEAHPEAKLLALTSPGYYGVDCDVEAIAALCHARGVKLLVDSAHGAHYPWIGKNSPAKRSDVCVISAHKTLPAPGQSGVLFANGFSPRQLREAVKLTGSSSPSYPMLAALDRTRDFLDRDEGYTRLLNRLLPEFRRRVEAETLFSVVPTDDPARLVLDTRGAGYSGQQAAQALEALGVYCEMADHCHLVCITTGQDRAEDFARLLAALRTLPKGESAVPHLTRLPELPERVCSLREALFAPKETLPLEDCLNRVAGEQIAPYPPGVPVVAPGERIAKKHLAYLREIGYNRGIPTNVLCTEAGSQPPQGEKKRGQRS